jgi:hypothetical protein
MGTIATDERGGTPERILSCGRDRDGELLVLGVEARVGGVYRVAAAE